jgi:hypothetical protein
MQISCAVTAPQLPNWQARAGRSCDRLRSPDFSGQAARPNVTRLTKNMRFTKSLTPLLESVKVPGASVCGELAFRAADSRAKAALPSRSSGRCSLTKF